MLYLLELYEQDPYSRKINLEFKYPLTYPETSEISSHSSTSSPNSKIWNHSLFTATNLPIYHQSSHSNPSNFSTSPTIPSKYILYHSDRQGSTRSTVSIAQTRSLGDQSQQRRKTSSDREFAQVGESEWIVCIPLDDR